VHHLVRVLGQVFLELAQGFRVCIAHSSSLRDAINFLGVNQGRIVFLEFVSFCELLVMDSFANDLFVLFSKNV